MKTWLQRTNHTILLAIFVFAILPILAAVIYTAVFRLPRASEIESLPPYVENPLFGKPVTIRLDSIVREEVAKEDFVVYGRFTITNQGDEPVTIYGILRFEPHEPFYCNGVDYQISENGDWKDILGLAGQALVPSEIGPLETRRLRVSLTPFVGLRPAPPSCRVIISGKPSLPFSPPTGSERIAVSID